MDAPPFDVTFELPGWTLVWAPWTLAETSSETAGALLDERVEQVVERDCAERGGRPLTDDPAIAELRRLLRAAGCDPTRYRSSPEALLRRLLKGEDLPRIHPLVDLGNLLSARLALPCCLLDAEVLTPPFVLRAGADGERYDSLRGDFNLAGKPLLADVEGPCDTPITGSRRAGVTERTRLAWFVAYLPSRLAEDGGLDGEAVARELRDLATALPAWRLGPVTVAVEES